MEPMEVIEKQYSLRHYSPARARRMLYGRCEGLLQETTNTWPALVDRACPADQPQLYSRILAVQNALLGLRQEISQEMLRHD